MEKICPTVDTSSIDNPKFFKEKYLTAKIGLYITTTIKDSNGKRTWLRTTDSLPEITFERVPANLILPKQSIQPSPPKVLANSRYKERIID
jgi:hypothetical protein